MHICSNCGDRIATPVEVCPKCGGQTGFPSNIVLAAKDRPHLMGRLAKRRSLHGPRSKKWRLLLDSKAKMARAMRVSINMWPESLINILSSPQIRYINLHDNRLARAVLGTNRYEDARRQGLDLLIFGPDGLHLTFGAFTLGGIGLYSYGAACVVLKAEESVTEQTSFLQDNSFAYLQFTGASVSVDVPPGVRALWTDGPVLVILKHEDKLLAGHVSGLDALQALILRCDGDRKTDEYVEAQLACDVSIDKIERIIYRPSVYKARVSPSSSIADVANHTKKLAEVLLSSGRLSHIPLEIVD